MRPYARAALRRMHPASRGLQRPWSSRLLQSSLGLSDGQSPRLFQAGRKVRSPQGSVPANGRGATLKGWPTESATENIPPWGFLGVRVKRCGKSAPRLEQSRRQGKPHAEQDQIGDQRRPAALTVIGSPLGVGPATEVPGRSLESGSDARPRRMAAARAQPGYRNRLIVRQASPRCAASPTIAREGSLTMQPPLRLWRTRPARFGVARTDFSRGSPEPSWRALIDLPRSL